MTTMSLTSADTAAHVERAALGRLWLFAASTAACASALIFDARVGINWLLCVMVASVALYDAARRDDLERALVPPLALALLVTLGMSITASEPLQALGVMSVVLLIAVAIARSRVRRHASMPMPALVLLPVTTGLQVVSESVQTVMATAREATGERSVPVVRGILLAVPVAVVFALLLSAADPTLDAWREAIGAALESLDFLPRLVFFGLVLGLGLGALSYVTRARPSDVPYRGRLTTAGLRLGESERLIVLATIATLFTLFLTLQLSYLFGDVASARGTGVTYAEWARRGFAELAVVATLCGAILLFLALHAPSERHRRVIFALELIVIGETQVLLQSAFRRVLLYEEAYGFTTARVGAQAFMIVARAVARA
jgi:hypothetical protein